jgi:cell division protein ZapA
MSEREPTRVTVRILEKEYFVACPPDERDDLLDSAAYLNRQMKEIRDSGKIVGADRIAVMAALNMANELLRLRERESGSQLEFGNRLKVLRERVESALEKGQQLEL